MANHVGREIDRNGDFHNRAQVFFLYFGDKSIVCDYAKDPRFNKLIAAFVGQFGGVRGLFKRVCVFKSIADDVTRQ